MPFCRTPSLLPFHRCHLSYFFYLMSIVSMSANLNAFLLTSFAIYLTYPQQLLSRFVLRCIFLHRGSHPIFRQSKIKLQLIQTITVIKEEDLAHAYNRLWCEPQR